MQRLLTAKETSHFLPGVIIRIQGSGYLTILISGSGTLATPELMFSLEMQGLVRV